MSSSCFTTFVSLSHFLTFLLPFLLSHLLSHFLSHFLTFLLFFSLSYFLFHFLTYLLSHLLSYLLSYFLTFSISFSLSYFLSVTLFLLLSMTIFLFCCPCFYDFLFEGLNPNSSELISNSIIYSPTNRSLPFGYPARAASSRLSAKASLEEYMLSYKYLIVLGGIVSADRLNTFLAHSGAVILLQETDFLYHYSAFLEPWVHYGEIT